MFRFHQHRQRKICKAAFVCLCILPTFAIAGWGLSRRLAWHTTAERDRLAQEIGLDVSLDAVRHPLPGVVEYVGLKLIDPESGKSILESPSIKATWTTTTDSGGVERPAVALAASRIVLRIEGIDRLRQTLQRRLECPATSTEVEIRVDAEQVAIVGERSQKILAVEGGIGELPGGTQAGIKFRLTKDSEPVQMRIVRNRQVSPPANGFEMETGPDGVPCSFLAIGLPGLDSLGPNCRFAGYVRSHQSSGGWAGDVRQARFVDADLASLVDHRLPHVLSGNAEFMIDHARFEQGRIEEATGTLTAGPGVIGRSLVDAAVAQMGLSRVTASADSRPTLSYDRLGLEFSIDGRGLTIIGRCPGSAPGVILAAGGTSLLGEPSAQPLPIVALIRTLVPASEQQVPATRQSDWLSSQLPVPDLLMPAPAPATRPSSSK